LGVSMSWPLGKSLKARMSFLRVLLIKSRAWRATEEPP
jgi:hypothetical protein